MTSASFADGMPELPPEAALIRRLRKAPPEMSMRKAAEAAGISPTRWEQIEKASRMFRGTRYPEPPGPAPTVARMAAVVGATPEQLRAAGRADAAGELEVLLARLGNGRQREAVRDRITRDTSNNGIDRFNET